MKRRVLLLSITVVLALCAAGGVWLHRERQQYALNRQLVAALVRDDTKTALALVNTGADPNTRIEATPAPTLPQLIKQLLHRTPPTVNDSPTAFLMACGAYWLIETLDSGDSITLEENLPLVSAMLAHGANVHDEDTDGRTALHNAVVKDRLHMVELLLEHGADVNAQDAQGESPLMVAAHTAHVDIAHLLLSRGANSNAHNKIGFTALRFALDIHQDKDILVELLAHGADPNLPDEDGDTPLQVARKKKRPDLVRLLERGGRQ